MSEPRDQVTTPAVEAESEQPRGLILLNGAETADGGECADGFCAV